MLSTTFLVFAVYDILVTVYDIVVIAVYDILVITVYGILVITVYDILVIAGYDSKGWYDCDRPKTKELGTIELGIFRRNESCSRQHGIVAASRRLELALCSKPLHLVDMVPNRK